MNSNIGISLDIDSVLKLFDRWMYRKLCMCGASLCPLFLRLWQPGASFLRRSVNFRMNLWSYHFLVLPKYKTKYFKDFCTVLQGRNPYNFWFILCLFGETMNLETHSEIYWPLHEIFFSFCHVQSSLVANKGVWCYH